MLPLSAIKKTWRPILIPQENTDNANKYGRTGKFLNLQNYSFVNTGTHITKTWAHIAKTYCTRWAVFGSRGFVVECKATIYLPTEVGLYLSSIKLGLTQVFLSPDRKYTSLAHGPPFPFLHRLDRPYLP